MAPIIFQTLYHGPICNRRLCLFFSHRLRSMLVHHFYRPCYSPENFRVKLKFLHPNVRSISHTGLHGTRGDRHEKRRARKVDQSKFCTSRIQFPPKKLKPKQTGVTESTVNSRKKNQKTWIRNLEKMIRSYEDYVWSISSRKEHTESLYPLPR